MLADSIARPDAWAKPRSCRRSRRAAADGRGRAPARAHRAPVGKFPRPSSMSHARPRLTAHRALPRQPRQMYARPAATRCRGGAPRARSSPTIPALSNLGIALYEQGQYEEALTARPRHRARGEFRRRPAIPRQCCAPVGCLGGSLLSPRDRLNRASRRPGTTPVPCARAQAAAGRGGGLPQGARREPQQSRHAR